MSFIYYVDLPSHVNMSGKLEIQWTTIANKFITWGSDISLYEVQPIRGEFIRQQGITKISNTTCAHLLATNLNNVYVKSIDIYPKSNSDILMAIGISNGRVALSTFGPSEFDTYGFPGKELIPRHGRQCNAVAFNPNEPNLIAAGLDKHRQDNSLLIWDINKLVAISEPNYNSRHMYSSINSTEMIRPLAEYGNAEFAYSLSWFNGSSKLLACGMNLKNIRMYDIRDTNKIVNSTYTKAVYGVCMNPKDDRQLASYSDNQIMVWDTRNFEKPVVVLPHFKPILKIAWCPTKSNLLGSIEKESSAVYLHDIQQTIIANEEIEPSVLERVVTPGTHHSLTSFSWHPTEENRFLAIAINGGISDFTVHDRITLNWAPNSNITWTHGRKAIKFVNDSFMDDISQKIKERTRNNYGLEENFDMNGKASDDDMLSSVWNWLHLSDKLVNEGVLKNTQVRHPGIQSILSIDPDINKSDTVVETWADLGYPNCQGSAKYYKHEDREQAIKLCGWNLDSSYFPTELDKLDKEIEYTRTATIAVFNLKIKAAIEFLTAVPENADYSSNLNIVAMALAGFSDDRNSVWKQFCASSKSRITDPYLKAMFAFLTTENHNYDIILHGSDLRICDKVAFACRFLPDGKLVEYIANLTEKLIEDGNLDGLLLTGNEPEGLNLLQKYLDVTTDIQSTALIAMRAFYTELGNENVKLWIDSYRNLLNTWKLWHERAHFDIKLASYRLQERVPQQVYIYCNFCGKSISAYMHGCNRGRNPYTRHGNTGNKVKLSSCPNCRKPLPRCSICLMYMGTNSGDIAGTNDKIAEFDSWFTWCQTCRHGGHAGHLSEWFKEHQECPVTGCSCKCYAIDTGC